MRICERNNYADTKKEGEEARTRQVTTLVKFVEDWNRIRGRTCLPEKEAGTEQHQVN